MKKFLLFFTIQVCCFNYATQENSGNQVVLPYPHAVERTISRYIFPDFFEKTSVRSQLVGNKSKDEVITILHACSKAYFDKIDQPNGREFFNQKIDRIAQELVANRPTPHEYELAQALLRGIYGKKSKL